MAFTRHGHYIPDSQETEPNRKPAKCGGVRVCYTCILDWVAHIKKKEN